MQKKKLLFLIAFNLLAVFIFVGGMFTAFYHVRDAIMWYSVNRAILASRVTYPTGYQVLEELNVYRRELGLPNFILYEPLCNNIGSRWKNYKRTNSHEGLQEFVNNYMPNLMVSEILAPGKTADEVVNNWKNSPSHDIAIKTRSRICVYSADGLSVALLTY